jgi:SAM-dependent methyltransferase
MWVRSTVRKYELAELETLEVGSRNYNGSPREFFTGQYIGVDMEAGKGVDYVMRASKLSFADKQFQCVITTEMFEHDSTFWLSMAEMERVLAPGGYLIITTRGIGFPYHEYPGDFWRFTEDALNFLFEYVGLEVLEVSPDPQPGHPGVFGIARKDA